MKNRVTVTFTTKRLADDDIKPVLEAINTVYDSTSTVIEQTIHLPVFPTIMAAVESIPIPLVLLSLDTILKQFDINLNLSFQAYSIIATLAFLHKRENFTKQERYNHL